MAPPAGTLRVGRYFLALVALTAVLYTIVFLPGNRHKPKLGIDLVGGLRVVFTALVNNGTAPPSTDQMTQARQILEDRINTTGVTGSTVVVQGNRQLVVEIPSGSKTDVAQLGKAAVLNFRGLIAPGQPVLCGRKATINPSASVSPSATAATTRSVAASSSAAPAKPNGAADRPLTKASPSAASKAVSKPAGASTPAAASKAASKSAAGSPAAGGSVTPSPSTTTVPCSSDPIAALVAKDPTLKGKLPNAETCPSPSLPNVNGKPAACVAYSTLTSAQQQQFATALQTFKCTSAQSEPDIASRYYIACDSTGTYAYLLGHVVVEGRNIDSANAQAPGASSQSTTSYWTVALSLNSSGADKWSAWTSKYHTSDTTVSPAADGSGTPCSATGTVPCSDFVGFTLDGGIVSLPRTEAVLDTQTSVSGNFSQTTSTNLARELNYGKLPISFRADDSQNVSATLGKSQLDAALLAGGIGLVLVVLYSLIYYRGLGLVTIASLLVSAALTYAMLVILATQIGFTLDLAGIAGFIVALGITADSFVVFFERVKDEVHDGRSVRVAVPRAWVRARRTILSADTVSFMAAAILYYFASADVKGFAFTLGMSTILDLVVVFLFTHPIVSLLSRSRAFASPRFTGLTNVRSGGIVPTDDGAPARRGTRPARDTGAGGATTATATRTSTSTRTSSSARTSTATRASSSTRASLTKGSASKAANTSTEAMPTEATSTGATSTEATSTGATTPTRTSTAAVLDDDSTGAAPQASTAAERAARRRARLRSGTSEDGEQG